ncbi:hypothetical protein BJ973_004829 [Actinoplanes tereljensis]|uniref:Uncharacterized protein n=1 Tax=Paractinoplanes tereljensis TaxID=571912 RepID=A0A919TTI3_9ACTN|nr:hypothetical protein [Actinoplanes tereljensis]GIF21726.1 hypothetical protein Ate02nite_44560 [Actinoplanes tereljensis]
MILQLAVAGAVLAAPVTAPVTAPMTYDPHTMTGYVGQGDVRRAFGWAAATLATRAPGLAFNQEFWTDDSYTVSCGRGTFPVTHHRDFGRYWLTVKAVSGYGKVTGWRITGANAGISGTSVAPAAGQPCPSPGRGKTVVRAAKTGTRTGCELTVTSQDVRRRLLVC